MTVVAVAMYKSDCMQDTHLSRDPSLIKRKRKKKKREKRGGGKQKKVEKIRR